MNKTVKDLKIEVETIKKTQMHTTLVIYNLGMRSEATDASITNRTRDRRENLRHRRYLRRHWHNSQRKYKVQKLITQNNQEIQAQLKVQTYE